MNDPEILTTKGLTKLIRKFKNPQFPLTAMGLFPEKLGRGHQAEWQEISEDRALGEMGGKSSMSKPVDGDAVTVKTIEMYKAFFNSSVDENALIGMKNPGSDELQTIGQDELSRRSKKLAKKIDRIKEYMISQAIQGAGTIKIDGKTVNLPDRLTNTHKVSGSDWSDASVKILEDVDSDLQLIEEDSGEMPKFALTSRECITALMQNETIGGFMNSTPAGVDYMVTGQLKQFKGLTWIAHNQVYKPVGGSATRFIGEDKIIYLCGIDSEIAEMQVGSVAVPVGENIEERIGRQSWKDIKKDPVESLIYGAETFMPVIYQPDTIVVRTWK